MSADWKSLSRHDRFQVAGDTIRVSFGERTHVVSVDDSSPDVILLSSTVAVRRFAPEEPALQLWKMNRYRELVGFRVVDRGRVIGECFVPKIGLSPDEWKTYVETLARSCDRLEYLWTGKDIE